MKIATSPQFQAARPVTLKSTQGGPEGPAPTPDTPPAPPQDQAPDPQPPVDEKKDGDLALKEFKQLSKASVPGVVFGALALGGAAAALGAVGGVVGGLVGATAGITLGVVGAIGGAAGLGYLGISKGPQDVRALFLGFGGLIVGAAAGGLLGHYGGGVLGAMAGAHGGLAGAAAGVIAGAPAGALFGGLLKGRGVLKANPEQYPTLIKGLEKAKKEAADEAKKEQK